jgi:metallophosphoesterase superfamily enzyme
VSQLQFFKPAQLIVVGDMFHSAANKELDLFIKWRNDFPSLQIQLIRGNHDILPDEWYRNAGLSLHQSALEIDAFSFVHDAIELKGRSTLASYSFTGHIHPGIRISGLGRQALQFPCFYFTANYCVLPAFSRFTGLAMIKPQKDEAVFGIVNQSIIKI